MTTTVRLCGVCETRPVFVRRRGPDSRCRLCRAAADALCKYWNKRGMPLAWASPRELMKIPAIQVGFPGRPETTVTTTGWRPTCAHDVPPVPQTILDCFAGAGTTLMVADRLGRNAIRCELSESYGDMGTARVVGDAPLFTQLLL